MAEDKSSPLDQDQIRYLGDVQRLELRAGDIIVLRLPPGLQLSPVAFERLKQTAEMQLPGHRVIVLEEGMTLGILSPTDDVDGSA